VLGRDGNLWFPEWGANSLASATTAGVITEHPIPTSKFFPSSLTVGPDDALWFTDNDGAFIGRRAL
jgi:virginiamycin B lyase